MLERERENATRRRGSIRVAPPFILLLAASAVILGCGGEKEEACVYSPKTDRGGQPVDCDDVYAIPAEEYEQREAEFEQRFEAAAKRREARERAREAREQAKETRRVLAKVCNGAGAPQAAAKPTGTLGVYGYMGYVTPTETWRPSRLGDAHLVACTSRDDQTVETCQYVSDAGPERVERQQRGVSAVIREARSGAQIASKTFLGGYPPECPPRLPGSENFVLGKDVNLDAVTRWLAQWRDR